MTESNYDFKLVFEKIEESKQTFANDSLIDLENIVEINESILEMMEIKNEMEESDQVTTFTTT